MQYFYLDKFTNLTIYYPYTISQAVFSPLTSVVILYLQSPDIYNYLIEFLSKLLELR